MLLNSIQITIDIIKDQIAKLQNQLNQMQLRDIQDDAGAVPAIPTNVVCIQCGESYSYDNGPPTFITQWDDNKWDNPSTACFLAAQEMAGGPLVHFDQGYESIDTLQKRDVDGNVIPNYDKMNSAIAHIRSELSSGRNVVVGINWIPGDETPNSPHDNVTNHFVTVYAIENDGSESVTLHFRDPGTSHAHMSLGTLELNNRGIMEGIQPYKPSSGNKTYQMTTVRVLQ